MSGPRTLLGLEEGSLAVDRVGPNLCLPATHRALKSRALFTPYGPSGRAPDVETVVASHDQVVETHELLHDLAVAAADHDHGDSFGQPPHSLTHVVRDHGVLRSVADLGQGSVVVEKHGRLLVGEAPRQRLALAQRVRSIANLPRHRCSPHFASRIQRMPWPPARSRMIARSSRPSLGS